VLAKSPSPSAESKAARSNGETKKLLGQMRLVMLDAMKLASICFGSASNAAPPALQVSRCNFASTL